MRRHIGIPSTKTDAVYEAIRGAIVRKRYAPGARLRQEQIAADLGVSPTPVREAFRRLEAEGLVQAAPHRGVIVLGASDDTGGEFLALTRQWERLLAHPDAVPGSDFP